MRPGGIAALRRQNRSTILQSRAKLAIDAKNVMGDRLRNGPRAANFLKKHDHRASLPSNANKIPGMAPPIAAWTHLWHSRKQTGPYGCAVDVAFPSKNATLAAGASGQTNVLSGADLAMKPRASSTQTVRFCRPLGAPHIHATSTDHL